MIADVNSVYLWLGIGASIIVILTGVFGLMRWVLRAILKELLPNGGKSLRDDIAKIDKKLDSHISYHRGQEQARSWAD